MKTLNLGALALLLLATPALATDADTAPGEGNCNDTNYGVQTNTYIIAERDCSWQDSRSYHQVCESTTKTGFAGGSGAGHGSEPTTATQAELTAGSRCDNGGNDGFA